MTDILDRSSHSAVRHDDITPDSRRVVNPWDIRSLIPPRGARPVVASVKPFAGCDRRQVWRIARWGEVIEARPGDVLVREKHTDFWFFVVLSGSLRATTGTQTVATLGPGDHFGETAIVGYRPQRATVTAVEPSVLFVLGHRYLLTLVTTDVSVQRALFPQAEGKDFRAFVRELVNDGRRDWHQLRPRYTNGHSYGRSVVAGRQLTWGEAIAVLSHQEVAPQHRPAQVTVPLSRGRFRLLPIAVVLAVLVVFASLYHPPFAVITPGRAVDVLPDIHISGARVYRPTGRYLLTPVRVDRPNLAGMFAARVLGRVVVGTGTAHNNALDARADSRRAHTAFVDSQRHAVALAERMLHVDVHRLTIAIRDRGFVGPSAGLVYALAIVDLLGPSDIAAHRVIAATGELERDGTLGPVGFVWLKVRAARAGGASVFLVPLQQATDDVGGVHVVGVSSLEDAVRALQRR